MTAERCLTDVELQALALGRMSESRFGTIQSHLETCPDCLGRAERCRPWEAAGDDWLRLSAAGGEGGGLLHQIAGGPLPADQQGTDVSGPQAETWVPADQSRLPGDALPPTLPELTAERPFGAYQLVSPLGKGGMGVVWRAIHRVLRKQVALKLLPPDKRSDLLLARFERERQSLALLDHPAIVRATDAGEVDGVHFLAMEYVDGEDLYNLVKKRGPLDVRQACDVVGQAARGLACAHRQGVVHRDVKPSNLMLTPDGQVKILDLGLARSPVAEEESGSQLTLSGEAFGTPDYMPREQWLDAGAVGPGSDLYALGCTLYFLLTGQPPFSGPSYATTLRKRAGHLDDSAPDLRSARRDVPPAVAAIYRRLMSHEPTERGSAEALACELQAFLDAPPAAAPSNSSPSSARNRGGLVAAGFVALVLVAGTALVIRERQRSPRENSASTDSESLEDLGTPVSAAPREGLEATLERTPSDVPPILVEPGEPLSETALVSRPERIAGLRSWSIDLINHRSEITSVAFSPDGRRVASGSLDNTLRIWDAALSQPLILYGHSAEVWDVDWSDDGNWIASGGNDGLVCFWDPHTGMVCQRLQLPAPINDLAFSRNSQFLAVADTYALTLISLPSFEMRRAPRQVMRVAWSPDSDVVYGRTRTPTPPRIVGFKIPELTTTSEFETLSDNSPLAVTPDGTEIIDVATDKLRVWNRKEGGLARELTVENGPITALAWLHDQGRLIIGCAGIDVWDWKTQKRVCRFKDQPASSVDVAPSGLLVFALDNYSFLTAYSLATESVTAQTPSNGQLESWAYRLRPDGRYVLTSPSRLFDANTGVLYRDLPSGQDGFWSPDSSAFLQRPYNENTIRVVDGTSFDQAVEFRGHQAAVQCAAWSPDSKQIVSIGGDETLRLWNAKSGELLRTIPAKTASMFDLCCIEPGPRVAVLTAGADTVQIWDMSKGDLKPVVITLPHQTAATNQILTPVGWQRDPSRLWVSALHGYFIDLEDFAVSPIQFPHGSAGIVSLSVSPDQTMVAGAWGRDVFLKHEGESPRRLGRMGSRMEWLPDSRRLLISSSISGHPSIGYDISRKERLGVLLGYLSDDQWLCIGPQGHLRGSDDVETHLRYVALHEDGRQVTYTPAEFRERFGWRNDPAQARFLKLRDAPAEVPQENVARPPILVEPGAPLSETALVSRPERIAGLRSWSLETVSHRSVPVALAWSPDGKSLVSGCLDHNVRIWDGDLQGSRILCGHSAEISDVAWSSDGKWIASSDDHGALRLWNPETGALRQQVKFQSRIEEIEFSPDNRHIAIVDFVGLAVVDLQTFLVQRGPRGMSRRVAWSPAGDRLFIRALLDGEMRIVGVNFPALQRVLELKSSEELGAILMTPDGKSLIESTGRELRVWDLQTRQPTSTITTNVGHVSSVTWSRLRDRLAVCGTGLEVWSWPDRQVVGRFDQANIITIALHDDELAASFGGSDYLRTFEVRTSEWKAHTSLRGSVSAGPCRILPDGGGVFVCNPAPLRIFDPESGALRTTIPVPAPMDAVWSPDGRRLVQYRTDRAAMRLVEMNSPDDVRELLGHDQPVQFAAWSPNSSQLASIGADKSLRVWESTSGKAVRVIDTEDACTELCWVQGGKAIVTRPSVGKSELQLWDLSEDPPKRRPLTVPVPVPESAAHWNSMAWQSSTGRLWFVTAHGYYLDLGTNALSKIQFMPAVGYFRSLAISPDDAKVAATEGKAVSLKIGDRPPRALGLLGNKIDWMPDSRRVCGSSTNAIDPAIGFDTERHERLGVLLGQIGNSEWACIGPEGHYRGSADIDEHLLYVALHEDGRQVTYTPAEFRKRFGWQNDPAQARFLKLRVP